MSACKLAYRRHSSSNKMFLSTTWKPIVSDRTVHFARQMKDSVRQPAPRGHVHFSPVSKWEPSVSRQQGSFLRDSLSRRSNSSLFISLLDEIEPLLWAGNDWILLWEIANEKKRRGPGRGRLISYQTLSSQYKMAFIAERRTWHLNLTYIFTPLTKGSRVLFEKFVQYFRPQSSEVFVDQKHNIWLTSAAFFKSGARRIHM